MSVVFTATALASRDSLTVRPQELATVVVAEKARLTQQMATAGMRRQGPWRLSVMWGRPNPATPGGWLRCTQRNATARVVRITATAVAR